VHIHSRALSALAVTALGSLLTAGLGACSGDDEPEAQRDESTNEVSEAGQSDVFEMKVGDCLSGDAPTGEVASVPVVPCAEAHDSEIFFSYTIPDGEFPTTEAMSAITDEQCLGAFESFVGLPYDQSVLEVTTLEPTSESWAQGDRELLCIVVDPAGGVTGSLAGAAR
jgi:hypothetical protein